MKLIYILFSFLIAFQSKSQERNYYMEGDTLIITNSEFVMDPFQFGIEPILFLKNQRSTSVDTISYLNRHVDNQIDSLFTFKFGKDLFQVFKNQSENFLTAGIIYSKKFPVQHGIIIGMKKNDFIKVFNLNFKEDPPEHFRIRDLEFLTWIDFSFENERLSKIRFCAILD